MHRMGRNVFNASAEIDVQFQSLRQLRAISAALNPEASYPAKQKAQAKIVSRGRRLKITLRARDSASLRAIINSYLRMLKATTNVYDSLTDLESHRN